MTVTRIEPEQHGEQPAQGRGADRRLRERRRSLAQLVQRAMFYAHLWVGVLFTVVLIVVCVTGILLNHKRGLGLMPEVEHTATAPFESSLTLSVLAERAAQASGLPESTAIDRMDVRPRNGFVKVRFRDNASTEVTVDIASGAVLHVGQRGDVFLEQLHSGEILGARWVLLTDAAAIAIVLLMLSGYWLWLAPRWRRR